MMIYDLLIFVFKYLALIGSAIGIAGAVGLLVGVISGDNSNEAFFNDMRAISCSLLITALLVFACAQLLKFNISNSSKKNTSMPPATTYIDPETGEEKSIKDDPPGNFWAGPDDSTDTTEATNKATEDTKDGRRYQKDSKSKYDKDPEPKYNNDPSKAPIKNMEPNDDSGPGPQTTPDKILESIEEDTV